MPTSECAPPPLSLIALRRGGPADHRLHGRVIKCRPPKRAHTGTLSPSARLPLSVSWLPPRPSAGVPRGLRWCEVAFAFGNVPAARPPP